MKSLIRKILKEETSNRFIEKVANYIKPPYYMNMEGLGLSEDEYPLVFSRIFNQPVGFIKGDYVYNEQGNRIYFENSKGYWYKKEYDDQGKKTYEENSNGYWEKYEYDDQGKPIYYENSDGKWYKSEYDEQGNRIYNEDDDGYWWKREYDEKGNEIYYEKGNEIYYENSRGEIIDNR